MLKQVHFQAIKSLLDVKLDLEQFTVLVGPNGAGKSTLLDQISLLCEMSCASTPYSAHVLGHTGDLLDLLRLRVSP
jgi:AAA15 family ATPase/GTPase